MGETGDLVQPRLRAVVLLSMLTSACVVVCFVVCIRLRHVCILIDQAAKSKGHVS
jgi:hypothetical protein